MFDEDKIILTGPRNVGKTSFLLEMGQNRHMKGIVSVKLFEEGRFLGYAAQDVSTHEKCQYLSMSQESEDMIGPFYIQKKGIDFVNQVIDQAVRDHTCVVLDEVGRCELEKGLYHLAMEKIINHAKSWILVIQSDFLSLYLERYPKLRKATVYKLERGSGHEDGKGNSSSC